MKIAHRAKLVDAEGRVSPLCAKAPRPINLKRAAWTNRDAAVTCSKCKAAIAEQKACVHEPHPLPETRSAIERAFVVTSFLCRKCGRTVKVRP